MEVVFHIWVKNEINELDKLILKTKYGGAFGIPMLGKVKKVYVTYENEWKIFNVVTKLYSDIKIINMENIHD
jgi:hypothetical protein